MPVYADLQAVHGYFRSNGSAKRVGPTLLALGYARSQEPQREHKYPHGNRHWSFA
jgi:hypothetical protein